MPLCFYFWVVYLWIWTNIPEPTLTTTASTTATMMMIFLTKINKFYLIPNHTKNHKKGNYTISRFLGRLLFTFHRQPSIEIGKNNRYFMIWPFIICMSLKGQKTHSHTVYFLRIIYLYALIHKNALKHITSRQFTI